MHQLNVKLHIIEMMYKIMNYKCCNLLLFQFVVVAQELCTKLKIQDYWADFINPFSGKPYMGPIASPSLYNTDSRFRCLGFQINQYAHCKVIATYTSAHLTGYLH